MESISVARLAITPKRQLWLLALLTLLLAGLFLMGWVPRLIQWQELERQAEAEAPLVVNTLQLEATSRPLELTLPTTTEAWHATPIWSRTNGYLKNFLVDIGDHVKEGQLLAEIDIPEIDQQLAQAQSDLLMADAKLVLAKISVDRWQNLFERNAEAVSVQEVDERRSSYQAVAAEVAAAKANVDRLLEIQNFSRIYAPFNGVITNRFIDIGSLISAGSEKNHQELFTIEEADTIRAYVAVPQSYYRLIKIGDEADVTVREFPGKVFKGTITRTSRSLDPVARTLLTEVDIDNRDGLLVTGLYAQVLFRLISNAPYFVIPTSSLIIREGHPHVAVLDEDDMIAMKKVSIGHDYGKAIEIIDGLQDRDRIITNPSDRVQNGVHALAQGAS